MPASKKAPPRDPASYRTRLLAGLAAIAAACFVFLKIWSEFAEHDPRSLDATIMLSMRVAGHPNIPIGPAWLRAMMIEISSLGGGTVLTLLLFGACGFLAIKGAAKRALWVAGAVLSGSLAVTLLKHLFGRPRPELIDHLVGTQTLSFPSGHAANSALVYLTIAALASDHEPSRPARIYLLAVAIVLTLMIGLSRIYLGVHWPSDVLAGWTFGAAWALIWRLAATHFSQAAVTPSAP